MDMKLIDGMSFKSEAIVLTVHASQPSQRELIHLRGVIECTDIRADNVLCHFDTRWALEM